ncbi:hypothetical protein D037_1086A, partial [Vibrio parahaemolyticus IDH02640]
MPLYLREYELIQTEPYPHPPLP